jgi:hypothetical protein
MLIVSPKYRPLLKNWIKLYPNSEFNGAFPYEIDPSYTLVHMKDIHASDWDKYEELVQKILWNMCIGRELPLSARRFEISSFPVEDPPVEILPEKFLVSNVIKHIEDMDTDSSINYVIGAVKTHPFSKSPRDFVNNFYSCMVPLGVVTEAFKFIERTMFYESIQIESPFERYLSGSKSLAINVNFEGSSFEVAIAYREYRSSSCNPSLIEWMDGKTDIVGLNILRMSFKRILP